MTTVLQVKEIFDEHYKDKDEYWKPLSEISRDTENNESMISDLDEYRFYSYDHIAKKAWGKTHPKSPDLLLFKDKELIFVEFKNGRIQKNKKKKYEIWGVKVKLIEGGFIVLHKIVSNHLESKFCNIAKLRKSYILVYNEDKNPVKEPPLKYIHSYLNSRPARWGFEIYRGTILKNVFTSSRPVFKQWLEKNKFIDAINPN